MLKVGFTLCLLGPALQGCQGFGRRGQGSLHHDQSGTSVKYEETEENVIGAGKYRH